MWVLQGNWWTGLEPKEKLFLIWYDDPLLEKMPVLQTNWWTGRELKKKLFLLCNDGVLPLIDICPLTKLMDRWRTEGETVCTSNQLMDRSRTEGETFFTLQWWCVAADRYLSFNEIDGQVKNRRRNCLYFDMMISCWWWMSVLQGHLGTGREQKEKLILL